MFIVECVFLSTLDARATPFPGHSENVPPPLYFLHCLQTRQIFLKTKIILPSREEKHVVCWKWFGTRSSRDPTFYWWVEFYWKRHRDFELKHWGWSRELRTAEQGQICDKKERLLDLGIPHAIPVWGLIQTSSLWVGLLLGGIWQVDRQERPLGQQQAYPTGFMQVAIPNHPSLSYSPSIWGQPRASINLRGSLEPHCGLRES